jgi:uncharacterized repeat protein (TIGR03803 family)
VSGGRFGGGVVLKLDTTGKEIVLHSFTGGADGVNPQAGLVRDAAGNLYGTASSGGIVGPVNACGGSCGVVFKLDTTGKKIALHRFTGGADGAFPQAGLVRGRGGRPTALPFLAPPTHAEAWAAESFSSSPLDYC